MNIKVTIHPSYEWSKEAQDMGISHRELEVLALLIQGKDNKQIADILEIKYQSVKNHTHNFVKLKVKNIHQAVAIAILHNLIAIENEINKDINIKFDMRTLADGFSDLIDDDKANKKKETVHLQQALKKQNIDLDVLRKKK